jgi:hypothetical protein
MNILDGFGGELITITGTIIGMQVIKELQQIFFGNCEEFRIPQKIE